MLKGIFISSGIVILILLILYISFCERNELWVRVCCCVAIIAVVATATYRTCVILRLRNMATEIPVHDEILLDDNRIHLHQTVVYVREEEDKTYSLFDKENHLLADSIRSWTIEHIEISPKDRFDAIEYVSFSGDTLLYDMYHHMPRRPEVFEPHSREAILWEFNYSNL